MQNLWNKYTTTIEIKKYTRNNQFEQKINTKLSEEATGNRKSREGAREVDVGSRSADSLCAPTEKGALTRQQLYTPYLFYIFFIFYLNTPTIVE